MERENPSELVQKAIIPAAGLGTRLLSATKESPKEMLSVFCTGEDGEVLLKPIVQLIFEQLFDFGIRKFCFVVGRGKRTIEDHFAPDRAFLRLLTARGKKKQARGMASFYGKVSKSTIVWVNQPSPRGFGDAVLCARSFIEDESFLVHAGDNHVLSPNRNHLSRMVAANRSGSADATLLLRKIDDPRKYGVAEVRQTGGELVVERVVEKPARPATKLALLPTYIFEPSIFKALSSIGPGKAGELQLTDGIQRLIDEGMKVNAVQLRRDEYWLDVGDPETYWDALNASHKELRGTG